MKPKQCFSIVFAMIALFLAVRAIPAEPAANPTSSAAAVQPDVGKRSGSSALQVPLNKWRIPAIRRPKPLALTAAQKASLHPPDWIVVYRPATGEIRYEPPTSLKDLRLKSPSASRPSNYGWLGKLPRPLNVIGDDDRVRVTPTTDFPWRVIGKTFMTYPNDSEWTASGALIDSFHVLTAGHVVFNGPEGGWARQIEFFPGLDGNYATFSSAWDVELRAPAAWTEQGDTDYDWGIITLDRNIGNVLGWLGYAYEPLDYYPGKVFNLAGYPSDLDQGLGLYWASGYATRATENVLYHTIDSSAGQSGGPVWRYDQASEQSHIMAVHAYGASNENSGARISSSRFTDIGDWTALDDPPTDYADLIDDGINFAGFSPAAVAPGAPFQVHCDVRNIGTAATGNFYVTFYASVDTTITAGDHFIGSAQLSTLNPFTYVTCTWTGDFPLGIPLGNYYVGWIIDSSNAVDEISEDNNTAYLPTQLYVGSAPNIRFAGADFSPAGPTQVAPDDLVAFAAQIQNNGSTSASPFWLEFWGSRTGGLTNSIFVANSARPGPINPGATLPFSATLPLSSIPDGPYTIVLAADRPNDIAETNENDNRIVVGGKRLIVVRPQTHADLAVQGFSFSPSPIHSGQAISLGGVIRNIGTQDSGGFWIEFFGTRSPSSSYPSPDFLLCDSILVSNLAPGEAVNLAAYPRTLYNAPAGTFRVGVVTDRLDQVNELDETNNYQFIPAVQINQTSPAPDPASKTVVKDALPDLVVSSADFTPASPYQAPPGTVATFSARLENRSFQPSGGFWVEFWGSRTGGLLLDELLADSLYVSGLGPWGILDIALPRPLYSVPDGPYTVVVVMDRPNAVAESSEVNNRWAVAGKRLLMIRPQTQANLITEGFSITQTTLHRGQPLPMTGRIRNIGTANSGPFWIEFVGTRTPDTPELDFFLCNSILVHDLAPGQWIDLAGYPRTVYSSVPFGSFGAICFPDRNDLVNETHEEDNYVVLRGFQVSP